MTSLNPLGVMTVFTRGFRVKSTNLFHVKGYFCVYVADQVKQTARDNFIVIPGDQFEKVII